MPPLTVEGNTLGKKHKFYNKLLKDAIANENYELSKINYDDSDLDNLLKIDIASKTKNIDFIIETLKCDDMLYVSRAIKTSTWLITDRQYADIINPEHLHTQLFPSMNTKAVNKLMLHIRLNLKDHDRVQAFYTYVKDTKDSYKWLEHCSIPFIQNVLDRGKTIPLSLYKRLCKRDIIFITLYKKVESQYQYFIREEILCFLNTHTELVLDLLENDFNNSVPKLGKKYTKIIMKKCPQKILEQFEKYVSAVDLSIVAKYMKNTDIKYFLKKQMNDNHVRSYLSNYDNLNHFIKNMPKDVRFEFIKKTFIDKITNCEDATSCISCNKDYYHWYHYAPFNVAFTDLKKLIRTESSPSERSSMLSILITSARRSSDDMKTLLRFYYEKHINEPFKFKLQFVNNLLTQTATHNFNAETWNILDQIFHSMEVYTESENNIQMCLQSIVLYKVLHDESIPDIIDKKIAFDTFIKFQHKLKDVQQEKIFTYLLDSISNKIQKQNIRNKAGFDETMKLLLSALALLRDWKKDINNYPTVIEKIKEVIKIKKENSWATKLSCLYNIKKSWRKHMLTLSLSLCQNQDVCLNALKHNPQLLIQHQEEMEVLRTNDALSLRQLLNKLRVYFPHTLAQQWIEAYLLNLNTTTGQKAVIRGLFLLLPQKQVIDMAIKYAPGNIKINWGETNQAEINLRKHIAGHLHVARPLIPLDTVLLYTKGDYLQFAVPSLNAILHYSSKNQSRELLPKLLDAPVSLQKYGLHLAFVKLKPEELQPIFLNIWKTTKNPTIRAVLFSHTYDSLCKVKNSSVEKDLWQLLSMFIDNLSAEESKDIYDKMGNMANIPLNIQNEFFMKSFQFLSSLPERANCKNHVNNLKKNASKIMHLLDEDFVIDKLLSPVESTFANNDVELLATFVLCGKTEEGQLQRYRKILVPIMEYAFREWNHVKQEEYYIRVAFSKLLTSLTWNFRKLVSLNRIHIPAKLFTEIKNKIEESMPIYENYVLFTSWKLTVKYVTLMDKHKSLYLLEFEKEKFSETDVGYLWMSDDIEKVWKRIHFKISPMFGANAVTMLKEDAKRFPTVCGLFENALTKMFDNLSFQRYEFTLEVLKHMLISDESCVDSYIVVCHMIPTYIDDSLRSVRAKVRKKVLSHPSDEVKMHYNYVFANIPEDTF